MNSNEEVTIAQTKALILRALEKGSQSTSQLHQAAVNLERDTVRAPSQPRILQLLFQMEHSGRVRGSVAGSPSCLVWELVRDK
jgi:hypothetical protein